MSPALAPIVACVHSTGGPQPAPLGPHGPEPRVSFRSLLVRQDAGALHPRAEPSKPRLAKDARFGRCSLASLTPAGASRPPSPMRDVAPAALLRRGQDLDPDDPLDPLHRHRAALAAPDVLSSPSPLAMPHPPAATLLAGAATSTARAATSLEDLVPGLVRRIAWSGDRHRGTVRLELGAGELAGATLLVHAEGGRVRVHLDVPPGVDGGRWQQRIRNRLASRGVPADAVEVT